jgi:hypothetical protein
MAKLSKLKATALRVRLEKELKGKRVLMLAGTRLGETAQVIAVTIEEGVVTIKLIGQDGKPFDVTDPSALRAI